MARYIIKAQKGSTFYIEVFATVSVTHNIAYKVVVHENLPSFSRTPTCPLQVSKAENTNTLNGIKCTFMLLNNSEMISRYQFLPYMNVYCLWYEDTISEKLDANAVYQLCK